MKNRALIKKDAVPPSVRPAALGEVSAQREDGEAPPLGRILRGLEARRVARPFQLDALPPAPAAPLPEPAAVPEAPASPPDPAIDEVRAAWEAEWQARHEAEVEAARAEGYEAGRAEAQAEAETEIEAAREAFAADAERLRAMWQDYVKKCEPLLATLAFDVAQSLLEAPLPPDVRAVSTQALTQALDGFAGQAPIDVTLHPDDLGRLEAYGLTDDLKALHEGLRWRADDALTPGDWIVQTPDAAVRRLRDEVLAHLKSRLGLLALVQKK